MTESGTTYTAEGWKALSRAARAYNAAHASKDPRMIDLARDVFHYVLRRVNRDCVTRAETMPKEGK